MTRVLIFHEVDDVARWSTSPKRDEFFGPRNMTVQTFVDPSGSNRVGLILDVPDMDALDSALQSEEAALAMKHDGVRADTMVLLVAT